MKKEKIIIVENDNLQKHLQTLKDNGYNYIIKAQDNFMSGWGNAENTKHIQLIACKTPQERDTILDDVRKDKTMRYINYWSIKDIKSIINTTYKKNYTIRNDWTRCF